MPIFCVSPVCAHRQRCSSVWWSLWWPWLRSSCRPLGSTGTATLSRHQSHLCFHFGPNEIVLWNQPKYVCVKVKGGPGNSRFHTDFSWVVKLAVRLCHHCYLNEKLRKICCANLCRKRYLKDTASRGCVEQDIELQMECKKLTCLISKWMCPTLWHKFTSLLMVL